MRFADFLRLTVLISAGEASIELGRSNLLGAIWWKTRQLLRVDLWL